MTRQTSICPLLRGLDQFEKRDFGGVIQTEAEHRCLTCPLETCIEDRKDRRLTMADKGRLGGLSTARRHPEKLAEWGREGGKAYYRNLRASLEISK
jgi:hypothetical protein